MKKAKRILALLVILTMVFALASCSVETEKGNEIKISCEAMVDAMMARDADAAYALFDPGLDKTSFTESFLDLCDYIDGVESYELRQVGWNASIDEGLNFYEATYRMETNVGEFLIQAVVVEGYEGIYNFHIISEEDANPSYTGTITSIPGSNIVQLAILAFSLLCLAGTVFSLVDCARRKMKYKVIFILLIILGFCVLTLNYSENSINFNNSIGAMMFSYSYLQIYSTGAWTLKIALPLGAIIYWIFRKMLAIKDEAPAPEQENESVSAEESDVSPDLASNEKPEGEETPSDEK